MGVYDELAGIVAVLLERVRVIGIGHVAGWVHGDDGTIYIGSN